ncbi:MAG: thiamine pyrophosphate-binding protein, partial [Gammaproteobacteria bacterium]|nr:thiamine pyrophosphate-binding protein [Gammaproteobacteria bacterium]
MTDTVSSILLKILRKYGIRHIFGLPAAQLGLVMDGASRDPFFKYVTTRHEEACGHMAHAISRVTDSLGVCFGTVGPGAMNMVPGVAAAWADNIPIIALTPNNQALNIDPGKDLLQNANQLEIYRPITKWNAAIRYPERAPELVERAIHMARSGCPGPVHLDIPCDVGTKPCEHDVDSIPVANVPRPAPSSRELDQVIDALRAARRPVLLAGGGVVRSRAAAEFDELIQKTGFPATTSMNARGVVKEDCPTHIGSGGVLGGKAAVRALQEADLVLAVGCKFSSWIPINKPPVYPLRRDQKLIQVDIDPEHLGKSAPVWLGIVADAREFLALLNGALGGSKFSLDEQWVSAVLEEFKTYRALVDSIADQRRVPGTELFSEAAAARAVRDLIPDDAIIVFDGGQVMEWTHTFIHPKDPTAYVFNPGMGHLGAGQPFANAARLAYPDRPVICITGDGAMGCTIQELVTAARYGLNTI